MSEPLGQTRGEFSVYFWTDPKGPYQVEKRWVTADEATSAARRLVMGPAAKLGMVRKVIITDALDCCNFHWEDDRILFPRAAP